MSLLFSPLINPYRSPPSRTAFRPSVFPSPHTPPRIHIQGIPSGISRSRFTQICSMNLNLSMWRAAQDAQEFIEEFLRGGGKTISDVQIPGRSKFPLEPDGQSICSSPTNPLTDAKSNTRKRKDKSASKHGIASTQRKKHISPQKVFMRENPA